MHKQKQEKWKETRLNWYRISISASNNNVYKYYKLKIMSMTRHFNRLSKNAYALTHTHISLHFVHSIQIEFNKSLSHVFAHFVAHEHAYTQIHM